MFNSVDTLLSGGGPIAFLIRIVAPWMALGTSATSLTVQLLTANVRWPSDVYLLINPVACALVPKVPNWSGRSSSEGQEAYGT